MKYPTAPRSPAIDDYSDPQEEPTADESLTPRGNAPVVVGRRDFFRLISAAFPLTANGCISDENKDSDQLTQLRKGKITAQIKVEKALLTQSILNQREHLSIDERLTSYVSLGDQCRITRNGDHLALYTVAEVRSEKTRNRLRMSLAARRRLDIEETFNGELDPRVVAEGLTDAEAQARSEFVERLVDDGAHTGLVVLAAHGGFIEPGTDEQAEHVRSLMAADYGKYVSSWICKGFKLGGGAFDRWHITTTDVSRNSFPGLNEIADREFDYAVSFHGSSEEGLVWVGGGAPLELKEQVRDAIADRLTGTGIDVVLVFAGDPHAGASPQNVVNWLTLDGAGGIQISQSMEARQVYGLSIAEAIVDVIGPLVD